MIHLNCSVSHWVLKFVIYFPASERRVFLSSSNILNCIQKWISSSTWVVWQRRHIRLATGVLGLVCLPLSISKIWELRRSRATAAISLVSVRSLTYVASFGKKEKELYVLRFVCWFWHEIFSVHSSMNLSSVCCLTLFMNLHLLPIVCVSQNKPRFRLKVNVFTCVVQFSIHILSSPKRQLTRFSRCGIYSLHEIRNYSRPQRVNRPGLHVILLF